MIDLSGAEALWQDVLTDLHAYAGHTIVLHYHGTSSGVDVTYDSFLGESMDGRDPGAVEGITVDTPDPVTVTGLAHTDLYGTSGSREAIEFLNVGHLQPGDVLFECLQAGVSEDTFVNVQRVEFNGKQYRLMSYHGRGLIGLNFLWDLHLSQSSITR